jgi:hypothetical protein
MSIKTVRNVIIFSSLIYLSSCEAYYKALDTDGEPNSAVDSNPYSTQTPNSNQVTDACAQEDGGYWKANFFSGLWMKQNFDPTTARPWMNCGFSPEDARQAADAGLSPGEAAAWVKSGVKPSDLQEIADWANAGFSPQDAAPWISAGINAAQSQQWVEATVSSPAQAQEWTNYLQKNDPTDYDAIEGINLSSDNKVISGIGSLIAHGFVPEDMGIYLSHGMTIKDYPNIIYIAHLLKNGTSYAKANFYAQYDVQPNQEAKYDQLFNECNGKITGLYDLLTTNPSYNSGTCYILPYIVVSQWLDSNDAMADNNSFEVDLTGAPQSTYLASVAVIGEGPYGYIAVSGASLIIPSVKFLMMMN